MKSRLNITAKIWLSIGVFIVGFVLSTVLNQLQGRGSESALHTTSNALFPAAQRSQEAEAGFQGMIKGLSDAVMMQDASALDRSKEQAAGIVKSLRSVASIPGLNKQRAAAAGQLADTVDRFDADARALYTTMLADAANLTPELQERMRVMAGRTDAIKAELGRERDQFSKDLQDQLSSLQTKSAKQRNLALAVFGATLVVAFVIVNLTIRKSITGPIMRVIAGVKQAADEAAQAAGQMTESGDNVARHAKEQASYLIETSSSLEEIAATTRENADRATNADQLMGKAKETVEQATRTVDDLTASMEKISKSSKQVSSVLKSIDEIAFYTNILALNAAVEAARAGEAGAGFSIVADEVRSLAQRAAEAAKSSSEMVEKTIADVNSGAEFVAATQGAFQGLSEMILSSSEVVSQIALASDEQAKGLSQIGQAVSRMEVVTQENADNAQQTAESAAAMTVQVQKTHNHLDELVAVVGGR